MSAYCQFVAHNNTSIETKYFYLKVFLLKFILNRRHPILKINFLLKSSYNNLVFKAIF